MLILQCISDSGSGLKIEDLALSRSDDDGDGIPKGLWINVSIALFRQKKRNRKSRRMNEN